MKFMNMKSKEAVSPVIAVILMVAITVVLAATVYVWVSGFGGGGSAQLSVSLSQVGQVTTTGTVPNQISTITYSVTSASSNAVYKNVQIVIGGTPYKWVEKSSSGDQTYTANGAGTTSIAIKAGETFTITSTAGTTHAAGVAVKFIDINSNSVIASYVLQ